jgi:hypothetical protein
MTEGNNIDYETLCVSFYSIIDNDAPIEAVVTETYTVDYEPCEEENDKVTTCDGSPEESCTNDELENCWTTLSVNSADTSSLFLPKEGIYKPKRIWERPTGHAVKGIDAT